MRTVRAPSGYGACVEFTQDVVVSRPLAEVVELLSDPEHAKHWQKELQSIEPLSGTPGQPGAKSKMSYESSSGRKFQLEETIVSSDLPTEAVSTYETSGMKHTVTSHLEALDASSTRVVMHNAMQLSGMAKLAGPILQKSLKEQIEQRSDDLKAYLER